MKKHTVKEACRAREYICKLHILKRLTKHTRKSRNYRDAKQLGYETSERLDRHF